jgi:GAF domain-containing protein
LNSDIYNRGNSLLTDEIVVPENAIKNWQVTINILAECANTPAALVMRTHRDEIEVLLASETDGNPYHPGKKQPLGLGLYCEKVMASRDMLLVPNALQDTEWDENPDIELGMISYCGLPLAWPNDNIFGTICVLDNKENTHNQRIIALLERFKDSICYSLAKLYETYSAQSQLAEKEKNLKSNLVASVEALAAIVEMRDPYTAGHQRRVAELAVAIGP